MKPFSFLSLRSITLSISLLITPMATMALSFARLTPSGKNTLTFISKQMGVPIDGRFKQFSAQLHFDPAHLKQSVANLDIDISSIDAGSEEANNEVKGKDWFDTEHFPKATFHSTEIIDLGDKHYQLNGTLTIKGKTKKITAPFTFKQNGPYGTFDGTLTINRTDYTIGAGAWADTSVVDNKVDIHFHFTATP
jgi:polyisoprenoid-binding protein YceI